MKAKTKIRFPEILYLFLWHAEVFISVATAVATVQDF
jgi:hypothetical protein